MSRHGLTFFNIDDTAGAIFADFGIPGNPAFAMVYPDDTYEVIMGAVPAATLDMIVQSALDRS